VRKAWESLKKQYFLQISGGGGALNRTVFLFSLQRVRQTTNRGHMQLPELPVDVTFCCKQPHLYFTPSWNQCLTVTAENISAHKGWKYWTITGHVTQSLRTTGLPIANIFCALISRGWKTRGWKVTSHGIGLSNQNPNNVAINKIWGGSEWSVPPPPPKLQWPCQHIRIVSQLEGSCVVV